MAGRVFVTGASGFVGSAILDELASRNYAIHALSNRRDIKSGGSNVRTIQGDLFTPGALDEGCRGCSAVIHIVGIIMEKPSKGITFERIHFEGASNVIDAAKRAGIKRFIHMSALGARSGAVSNYHKTKFQAEEYLRASGLDWTIFRPSLIHGAHGEFMQMEAKWARGSAPPFLFMPYFGAGPMGFGGAGKLQPVYVKDVSRAFVDALDKPNTVGEVYPLGGPDQFTWKELHQTVSQAVVNKKRWVMPLPAWYAKVLASVVPGALLPFNKDQVIMSQEDNTCDLSKFVDDFGWTPQKFTTTLNTYAGTM